MVNFNNYKPIDHKKTLLTVGTVFFPVAGLGLMAKDSYDENPDEFKKNIESLHNTIKNDIGSSIKTSSVGCLINCFYHWFSEVVLS